ncbi:MULTISPECIES: ABC transporter substrate-binding protein [unclassified Beijerinckia]|uniref:ABC transporter substrate-binding protein n=1 Tax=unclassified Beijerinckia TaxID=2638183 RepID=UPI000897FB6F|nr:MULTISPECIES: ABC transporter substrate-binding protein [unclassified Beijerinckia]MDH7799216.1 sulfonate transport system substrate-binding protein [Beijerinckia sp. GAS462]SED91710.1 NitT/TauT family transport system substrate-binding protein [Beijerinckia sp. 28-YEA-48]
MRMPRFLAAVLSIAFLMGKAPIVQGADLPKIRIGWIAAPTNLAPILFAKAGIAQHLGKTYELEPIRFNGSPPMITALYAGELDIALLAYSSFALAVENAKMEDLRAFADDIQGNIPGYFADGFLVRKDSPLKTIEDLKGKVLATNGVGGAVDIALRVALRSHKMEDKRDVTIIEAPLPSMKAMLLERKVDLIPAVVPFAYDPELMQNSRMLFARGDSMGPEQTLLWAARASFLQKNRSAMVDFMEDVLRARDFYLDPKNHQEAVDIVVAFTKQPRVFFDSWVFTSKDNYRDPNALPNLEAMQSNIDKQKELGFIRRAIDVKKYSDLTITLEAGARLRKQ